MHLLVSGGPSPHARRPAPPASPAGQPRSALVRPSPAPASPASPLISDLTRPHLTWQVVSTARHEGPPSQSLPAAPEFRLEPAGPVHAAGMLAIYNREIESGTATFDMSPRSLEDQLEWLAEHSGAHPAVAAVTTDDDGEDIVIGFGSLSPYRPRAAYSTTVEDSVYVTEGLQRLGIGRVILEELLRLGEAHGFHAVMARIGGHNDASVALHESCGFEMIGTEREVGRKFGRWLDVVCMQRLLGEAPPS
jgi:L-amino acid N-acyltransferase